MQDLKNKQCFIVAGGSSLRNFDWRKLDGKYVIAINRSYEQLPYADVVYFTDKGFWDAHRLKLINHVGRLIRGVQKFGETDYDGVEEYLFTGTEGFETEKQKLRSGNNSTYAAINLAYHLGFKKIYLLGVDMKWGKTNDRSTSHWHDGHKHHQEPEASFNLFKKRFETIVAGLEENGIEVININPESELNTFKKVSQEEVFGYDDGTKIIRGYD